MTPKKALKAMCENCHRNIQAQPSKGDLPHKECPFRHISNDYCEEYDIVKEALDEAEKQDLGNHKGIVETRKFVVLGEVRGKMRPKASSFGGHAKVYTPSKQIEYENWVRLCYQKAYPDAKPMEGSICAHISVLMRVPKSASKKKRDAMLAGEIKPTKKPDLDNCIKQLDALNGVAFADDSQIVEIHANKSFAEEDSMSITLMELD